MELHNFKQIVIKTLLEIDLYSVEAEELLLGTAAQESNLKYIKQLNNGPALGYFQMEPTTHDSHVGYLTNRRHVLGTKIKKVCGVEFFNKDFLYNLKYAICMTRIHYLRRPEPIPKTMEEQAKYWKKWYNTYKGKGTVAEYMHNYERFILQK